MIPENFYGCLMMIIFSDFLDDKNVLCDNREEECV